MQEAMDLLEEVAVSLRWAGIRITDQRQGWRRSQARRGATSLLTR